MKESSIGVGDQVVLQRQHLDRLFEALSREGYRVIGPVMRDGAIIYDELTVAADLPIGWTDEQDGGSYRLKKRADMALFGYTVGPHSWKRFLHLPALRLWQARQSGGGFEIRSEEGGSPPRCAFIGVRACELRALAIQDRVFLEGAYVDASYRSRRKDVFIVAVNCGQARGTCFCVSMGTGPKATAGFDLSMTEVLDADRHYFLVEVGSDVGAGILSALPYEAAGEDARVEAGRVVASAASQMGRVLDTTGVKDLLYRNTEHPRWDDVARRCLACGNCTMVCPTCFCTSVQDVTDLAGQSAERWRMWDSCFTVDFSYIYGGSVRPSAKARYRQWLTHKLGTWIDQFGTSGCVGCGRCITWCPVAIDITEEVRAIRESERSRKE
jgi:sulfhydrogenase subunit beta (sulfur reductase)